MVNKKITVGVLTLILLVSSIVYITLEGEGVRFRVDSDKTTLYVINENNRWIVGGREYNKLFDGTSQMNRNLSGISVETVISGNDVIIKRTTQYIRGPTIIDTYLFRGNISDKKLFPIYHKVEILNGKGYFYRYEVRELKYDGDTVKLTDETELKFGNNVDISLNPDYRWAYIYKSGIVKAQYDIPTNHEVYYVRLFDPEPETGLNAMWHFDAKDDSNSEAAIDTSGYGNDGVVTGPLFTNLGRFEEAYIFDGDSTKYIRVPDDTSLEVEDSASGFAFSIWFKADSGASDRHGFLSKDKYRIDFHQTSQQIRYYNINTDGVETSYTSNAIFTYNEWNHVVIVINTSAVLFYRNGVFDKYYDYDNTSDTSGQDLYLGRDRIADNPMDGLLDEIRIYNRSLSATEVAELYTGELTPHLRISYNESKTLHLRIATTAPLGLISESQLKGLWSFDAKDDSNSEAAIDTSGYGNDGVVTGPLFTNLGRFEEAYWFDGKDSNNMINCGSAASLDNNNNLTWSAWIYANDLSTEYKYIMSKYTHKIFYVRNDNQRIDTIIRTTGGADARSTSNTQIVTERWYHLAITYADTGDRKIRIYIDGTEDAYITQITGVGVIDDDSGNRFVIGMYNPGSPSYEWDGLLDEVRIYNRSLSAGEVEDLYSGVITPHYRIGTYQPLGLEE